MDRYKEIRKAFPLLSLTSYKELESVMFTWRDYNIRAKKQLQDFKLGLNK